MPTFPSPARTAMGSLLIAALALPAGPAATAQDEPASHRVHRKIVVRSSPGGEPIVVEGMRTRRAFLGVHVLDLTPELRRHFGADGAAGVLVSRLEDGGPAAAAGARVGDVLLALDDDPIRSGSGLIRQLAGHREGETVDLALLRAGERRTLRVSLQERERPLVDIRELVWQTRGEPHAVHVLPEIDLETLEEMVEIDPETLEKALAEVNRHLGAEGSRGSLLMIPEREMLMERIDELERRLRELEEELAALPKR